MTSKELLKNIQDNYTWEEGVFYKEHFKQIEKDLEVLEILKKLFITAEDEEYPSLYLEKRYNLYEIVGDGYGYWMLHLTENEYNAIKEWLNG